jgi:integrase
MAWIERRGQRFRLAFRYGDEKFTVNLKSAGRKDAEACRARLEENLRLVERGRLTVPTGADLGLYLLSDGKLERKVEIVRVPTLAAMFEKYQTTFTAGAKEAITRRMEDVHIKHLTRIIGGDTPISAVVAGTVQQFIDTRSRETYKGHPIKPKSVKKAVATLRFVWNWSHRQGYVPLKYPTGETVYAKEKQAEPFRTYAQIKAIIARGSGLTKRRLRELWDGLFLDPAEVAEVLEIVRKKTRAKWLYPFLVAATHTGARRSELFRARIQDLDFEAKLVLLREKKRSREKETHRPVDMTPFVASVLKRYFATTHPGGDPKELMELAHQLSEIAGSLDALARAARRERADALRAEEDRLAALAAPLDELDELADLLAHAALEAAGYHRHRRGEWRKRRVRADEPRGGEGRA